MSQQMINEAMREIRADLFIEVANILNTNDESIIIGYIRMNKLS